MAIKAVIFDCFGVFYIDPINAYLEAEQPDSAIAQALTDLDLQSSYGMLAKDDFVAQTAELLAMPPAEVTKRFLRDTHRNTALLAYATELREHYRLGMLSNLGGDMMDSYFTAAERGELFDDVVLSGDVGLAKPEAAIFLLACKRLGVAPDEAVMIDDSLRNIDAARALGMGGIVYTGVAQCRRELTALLAL